MKGMLSSEYSCHLSSRKWSFKAYFLLYVIHDYIKGKEKLDVYLL